MTCPVRLVHTGLVPSRCSVSFVVEMEEQCNADTAVEQANTSLGCDSGAVVAEVAAKDDAELQQLETVPCTRSVSELPNTNSTQLSLKEDVELSSLR